MKREGVTTVKEEGYTNSAANSFQQINTRIQWSIYKLSTKIIHFFFDEQRIKEKFELLYWKYKKLKESTYTNTHYEYFFTSAFNLDKEFYKNKKIMDIGCGPRGSLEWAANAFECECVGVDPLADKYEELNGRSHKMKYVKAYAENIPFDNNYFDVISSFNSFDHVNDPEKVLSEIKRVLKPKGTFLLITDFHPYPALCEPNAFGVEVIDQLKLYFSIDEMHIYEKKEIGIYTSIRSAIPYNLSDVTKRNGVLMLKMKKQ